MELRLTIFKAIYSSILLLIFTCALVKLSIIVSVKQLTPNTRHQYANKALAVVVGLWFVAATLISSFQCPLPRTWDFTDASLCVDRDAWWAFVAVVNMLTDFGIAALIAIIMSQIHVSLSRKAVLVAAFSTRLLVVAAAAAQLSAFRATVLDRDIAYSLWLPTVLNQVVICLSIVTACLPYLKPFMASLDSGILRVDDTPESEDGFQETRTGLSSYSLNIVRSPSSRSFGAG
ncbi:hypothetical protein F5Y15DRAFT_390719 [Xylariaceae sp. FL0016]|nr:hypothetical protein F5Y15DRAFT_390719 [Xylariaceae sp. FL0016]